MMLGQVATETCLWLPFTTGADAPPTGERVDLVARSTGTNSVIQCEAEESVEFDTEPAEFEA